MPLINDLTLRGEYLSVSLMSPEVFEKRHATDSMSTDDAEMFLIVDKEDRILGRIAYFKSHPHYNALEVGYHILSVEHRGSGIATDALRMLVEYLFKTKLINRLEVRMDVDNVASQRVAIKCDFRQEGISRGAIFRNGRFVDTAVYAILRQEWEALFFADALE
jgi:[ribosomal protein S5]-alanine N-acetyltransferase